MHLDTRPEVETILFRLYRETPAWRKLEQVGEMNTAVRTLALSGLRRQYPDASEQEIKRRLADLLLGPELAARVYGSLSEKEPV
ncbi:MAG: hypothetical protein M5U01_23365 [Ardenticatenaceae bacterium]|nr:hypothetical protein [Ardenticatenaceae bacterium]